MEYTHDNGVMIKRLESGAFEATHEELSLPVRSMDGVQWVGKRGALAPERMECTDSIREAWYAFAGLPGEEGEGDAEPETYSGPVEDWPDGMYKQVADSDCQHDPKLVIVREGRAFCSTHRRVWHRTHTVGVETKYARTGDFDPSVLFGGVESPEQERDYE